MKNQVRGTILLLLASLLWGFAFVAQSVGGKIIGAFTFNAIRLLLGALFLHFAMKITDKVGLSKVPIERPDKKRQFIVGCVCGFCLLIATNLQQVALNAGATAGKAGFLTAMYILFVPLIGLFFKKKCGWNVWVAIAISIVGLYFLCITDGFVFQKADIYLLLDAIAFAMQIVMIDIFGKQVDSLRLSAMQFLFAGVITFIIALFVEIIPYPGGFGSWIALFANGRLWLDLGYLGICSCGIAYTLQILGQKDVAPSLAALIMSLESVFSMLGGWLILKEQLSTRELEGCIFIFAAVIFAQIEFKHNTKNE